MPPAISITDLPPPPPRSIQWRRALRQIPVFVVGAPEDGPAASYAFVDALGGRTDDKLLRRFLATADGQRLARERPSLPDVLADWDRLARLPEGSFGRAYLALARRHGIRALDLLSAQHRMSRDYGRLDPLRQWFSDRLTVMHDLWHVLAGYDATSAGESAIVVFGIPQGIVYRPIPVYVVMMLVLRIQTPGALLRAFRRGWRTAFLVGQPYEELLPLPLGAVRARLGLDDPAVIHARDARQAMLIPA